MTDRIESCRHYYADPSGGFGWPSCVKCGASVPIEESYQLRACCQTRTTEDHASACTSMDAWLKREVARAERE